MNNIAKFISSELKSYEKYGVLTQEYGTKLIGKAPHIASMAWLHMTFKGLKAIDLEITASELNTKIPEDYAEFLIFSNGLDLFNGTLNLFGRKSKYNRSTEINNRQPFDLEITNIYERPLNSKEDYFFIGSYNWDGSLVFINKLNNKVHRCNGDDAEILNTWTNLNDFLKTEILRLKSLHNENGTEKEFGKITIPI